MPATIKYFDNVSSALSAKLPVNNRVESTLQGTNALAQGTVAFDSSYPTGGYAASKFGLKTVNGVFIEDVNGYGVYYNKTTDKIQVFSASGTEVVAATNLSALPAAYYRAEGLFA